MPQFDSALPPGIAGWVASQQLTNQTNQANLGNLSGITGILAKLQSAQKEQEFRGALASAQTPDEQLQIASKYMGPDALGKMIQGSQDRRVTSDNTKQVAMARLGQTLQKDLADMSFKERAATSAEEKFHWQQQMDALKASATKQAADIAAGRFNYEVGTPIEPFRGVVPQPGTTVASAAPQPNVAAPASSAGATVAPSVTPMDISRITDPNDRFAAMKAYQQQNIAPNPVPNPAPIPSTPSPVLPPGPTGNQDMRDLQSQLGPRPAPAIASQLGPQSAPIQTSALIQPAPNVPPTTAPVMPTFSGSPREIAKRQNDWRMLQEKNASTPVIAGDALELAANRYRLDGTLPTNLGRGQQGSINTIKILDRAAELAKLGGDTAEETRIKQIGVKAKSLALNSNTRDLTAIRPYNEMLEKNGSIAMQLADKAIATNAAFANKPINWLITNASDNPDVSEFLAQVRIVSTEAARVLNNPRLVGELTDTARKDMDLVINGSMPLNAFKRVIERLQADGRNRVNAMIAENERLTRSIGNQTAAPQRRATDNQPAAKTYDPATGTFK